MSEYSYSVILLLISVLISSVSQILLKKSALKKYPSKLAEYLNAFVISAYALFFLSTILTMLSLRQVPLSMQPILESASYVYISVMGYFFLKEQFSRRKILGIGLIILGIFVYSL